MRKTPYPVTRYAAKRRISCSLPRIAVRIVHPSSVIATPSMHFQNTLSDLYYEGHECQARVPSSASNFPTPFAREEDTGCLEASRPISIRNPSLQRRGWRIESPPFDAQRADGIRPAPPRKLHVQRAIRVHHPCIDSNLAPGPERRPQRVVPVIVGRGLLTGWCAAVGDGHRARRRDVPRRCRLR